MSAETEPGPHEQLEGLELQNGWRVLQRLGKAAGGTGGHFSCGYLARDATGRAGYLKALDFYSALKDSADPARDLQPLLEAFNFERDLLRECRTHRMSRIVTALDDGAVRVSHSSAIYPVQYIVFELADGDVRLQMDDADSLEIAWRLRSLHHITVGLAQLHARGVAHQDLKPSNVLLFDNRTTSKLADLGRAAARGKMPPHYDKLPPGDVGYAPPELLYSTPAPSWEGKRQACDVYHLGSMISSLFTGVAMTPLLLLRLPESFHWRSWSGGYDEVLPYLRSAFAEAIEYISAEIPAPIRTDLTRCLRELCDPDPGRRGHPRDRMSPQARYAVMRYVAQFDLLARRAELLLTRTRS
jgi:serine/threonine protein kinase